MDLDELIQTRNKASDSTVAKKLNDVIKMVQLQKISQDDICKWSLSQSKAMRRLKQTQRLDNYVLRKLQEQKR